MDNKNNDEDEEEWVCESKNKDVNGFCDEENCFSCASRECEHGEPLHRHHDGCPAGCGWMAEQKEAGAHQDLIR